jgi:hypothetical protein
LRGGTTWQSAVDVELPYYFAHCCLAITGWQVNTALSRLAFRFDH